MSAWIPHLILKRIVCKQQWKKSKKLHIGKAVKKLQKHENSCSTHETDINFLHLTKIKTHWHLVAVIAFYAQALSLANKEWWRELSQITK